MDTQTADTDQFVAHYDGYDKTVFHWVQEKARRDNKAIPLVFASPERAFAQMAKILSTRFESRVTPETVPLPFLSLQRLDCTLDTTERWRMAPDRKVRLLTRDRKPIENLAALDHDSLMALSDADKRRIHAWEGYDWPQPTKMRYQVDAWARILRDLDLISNCFMLGMARGDLTYLRVGHPEPFGEKIIPMQLNREQNLSQLEAAEGQDRTLRRSYEFEVTGWIPRPALMTPLVKRIEAQWSEQESGEVFDEQVLIDERHLLGV